MKIKFMLIYFFNCLVTINLYSQINSFNYQQIYVKDLVKEINKLREDPSLFCDKYKCKELSYYKKSRQLKIDDKLSYDCYLYAKYLASIENLIHSPSTVPASESLCVNQNVYSVITHLIQEINYNGDGHRRHMVGDKNFGKEKIIGIGFYKNGENIYCVIRSDIYYRPDPTEYY